jgi:DNA-directed RNA polymerase specialized sigma24 family protein
MLVSNQGSITRWLGQLKGGDADAVQPLWEAYFHRLVDLAELRLNGVPKRVADEEDVALSAFYSFCRGARQGNFPQLADRHNLWPLLVAITAHKCVDLIRRQTRHKRGGVDGFAEVNFDVLISTEPSPEFVAQLNDQLDHLLASLDHSGDPDLRQIALGRMAGDDVPTIADRLGCARRTVERKLVLIARQWETEAQP